VRRLPAWMIVMALALAHPAHAGDRISYNQLDLGLGVGLFSEWDTYLALPVRAAGSVEITSHLFAYGSWERARYSAIHLDDWVADNLPTGDDEEYDHLDSEHALKTGGELGLGLNWPLNPSWDMFLGASWLQHRQEFSGGGLPREVLDGDGANVQLGLRAITGARLAWSVVVNVASLDTQFRRAAQYPYSDAQFATRRRELLGVTGGFRMQLGAVVALGADLSAIRFAGRTDLRALLELRLQFRDWD
jgi:hypothetical protein